MHKVILHYHLFKNAGTSLDAAFKEYFKEDKWVTEEFPAGAKNSVMVKQWIIGNPQAQYFSSHTAMLPPPEIADVAILPVIFFRHPIDRIASVYAFEKTQNSEQFGATLARNTSFRGYIETRLSLTNDHQCRNFHMERLATMFDESHGDKYTRARMALDKLPFVGVVEDFSGSLSRLEEWLKSEGFTDIQIQVVQKNVSRDIRVPLDEKLEQIREELGDKIWEKLNKENEEDLSLYQQLISNTVENSM